FNQLDSSLTRRFARLGQASPPGGQLRQLAPSADQRQFQGKLSAGLRHTSCSRRGMVAVASNTAPIQGKPLGLCCIEASVLIGLDAHSIRVEVCCTRGPSLFQLVGLADAAVREARVRITSSLARLGILVDEYALTVNLAPADLRKSGA